MNYILNRNRVIVSLSGHSVEFKKGEPTHVPPAMVADVIAAGGVPEHEVDEPEVQKPEVPQGEDRVALIRAAMEDMVAANDRETFTAGGAPHTKVLTTKLGFTVHTKERDSIWEALKQAD